jgi:hypothetical protein
VDLWQMADLTTPWCLRVVATLQVAEHIQAGKTRIAELSEAAGADPDSLSRVLRHLAGSGIFEEPETGRFALNEAARGLLEPPVKLGLDLNGIGGRMAYPWSTLLSAVRTSRTAYHEVFGKTFWEDLDAYPEVAASFDELMGPAGHGRQDGDVLLEPGDWKSVRTVVDVGGGTGALLAAVLRERPALRGTLVDLPRVMPKAGELLAAEGVADRVTLCPQSFFDPLPAGADLYLLKSVLSDWPDNEAKAILSRCAEAARPSGRVLVLNGVTPEDRAFPDLLMLVLVGGKERTLAEFRVLADEAGLKVRASGRQKSGRFVVECVPLGTG